MADRLLQANDQSTALGTYTVYTVPADRHARVKLIFRSKTDGSNASDLILTVAGVGVFSRTITAGNNVLHSTPNVISSEHASSDVDGSTEDKTVAPYERWFYLTAGDTVQYTIGSNALDSNFVGVMGAEIDNS